MSLFRQIQLMKNFNLVRKEENQLLINRIKNSTKTSLEENYQEKNQRSLQVFTLGIYKYFSLYDFFFKILVAI